MANFMDLLESLQYIIPPLSSITIPQELYSTVLSPCISLTDIKLQKISLKLENP
jgi:hypothetical protein